MARRDKATQRDQRRQKRAADRERSDFFEQKKSLDFLFAPAKKATTTARILGPIAAVLRNRFFRRFFVSGVVCLAVAIPAYLAIRDAVSHDESAPPSDDDLRAQWRNVGRADNGYFLVAFPDQLSAKLRRRIFIPPPEWPDDDVVVHGASELFDPKAAEILLEQRAGALKRFEACLKTADFVVPMADPNAPGTSQTTLVRWKEIGRLVRCRSRYLYESGDKKLAIEEALKLIRFGQRVVHSQGGIRSYLVGCQLSHWGVDSILWLINEGEYRAADLKSVTAVVGSHLERGFGLEESFRTDYTLIRGTIDGWAKSVANGQGLETQGLELGLLDRVLPDEALFKPNETRRKLMAGFRLAVSWAQAPYPGRPHNAESLLGDGLAPHELGRLNAVGNAVVRTTLSALPPALVVDARLRFQLDALSVTVALHEYKEANGKLPETLDELVPTHLEAIPTDPADGKPIRYSAQKKILYGIGSDREDGGGSRSAGVKEALADVLEPTFRIHF